MALERVWSEEEDRFHVLVPSDLHNSNILNRTFAHRLSYQTTSMSYVDSCKLFDPKDGTYGGMILGQQLLSQRLWDDDTPSTRIRRIFTVQNTNDFHSLALKNYLLSNTIIVR